MLQEICEIKSACEEDGCRFFLTVLSLFRFSDRSRPREDAVGRAGTNTEQFVGRQALPGCAGGASQGKWPNEKERFGFD